MEPNLAERIYIRSSIKFLHFVPFRQQIWPPRAILVSDWLILKKHGSAHVDQHGLQGIATVSYKTYRDTYRNTYQISRYISLVEKGCYALKKIWPVDLDLWPWKSIGFQILIRTKYVPSLVKIHWRMLILECSQGCYAVKKIDLVTLTLKIDRVDQLFFFITRWTIQALESLWFVIPSPTKLRRDIVTLPSVSPSFCPSVTSLWTL
jgi:hypothetical protein